MTNGLLLAVFIEMGLVIGGIEEKVISEKSAQVGATVSCLRPQFDAIAGAQDQPFVHARMSGQALQSFRKTRLWDRQPLPYFYRCGFVIDPDELKVHD
jgi:hypothetical protein